MLAFELAMAAHGSRDLETGNTSRHFAMCLSLATELLGRTVPNQLIATYKI